MTVHSAFIRDRARLYRVNYVNYSYKNDGYKNYENLSEAHYYYYKNDCYKNHKNLSEAHYYHKNDCYKNALFKIISGYYLLFKVVFNYKRNSKDHAKQVLHYFPETA